MNYIGKGLDRVDKLEPGRGKLEWFGRLKNRAIGGGLEYEHRVGRDLSLFGRGNASWDWAVKELGYEAMLGGRLRF